MILSVVARSFLLLIGVTVGFFWILSDSVVLLRIGVTTRFLSVLPRPLSEPDVLSRTGVGVTLFCVLVDSVVLLRIGVTTRFLSVLPRPLSEPDVLSRTGVGVTLFCVLVDSVVRLRIGVTTADGFLPIETGAGFLDGLLATCTLRLTGAGLDVLLAGACL